MVVAPTLTVTDKQRAALEQLARSTSAPHRRRSNPRAADGVGTNAGAPGRQHDQRFGPLVAAPVRVRRGNWGGQDSQGLWPAVVVAGRDGGGGRP